MNWSILGKFAGPETREALREKGLVEDAASSRAQHINEARDAEVSRVEAARATIGIAEEVEKSESLSPEAKKRLLVRLLPRKEEEEGLEGGEEGE